MTGFWHFCHALISSFHYLLWIISSLVWENILLHPLSGNTRGFIKTIGHLTFWSHETFANSDVNFTFTQATSNLDFCLFVFSMSSIVPYLPYDWLVCIVNVFYNVIFAIRLKCIVSRSYMHKTRYLFSSKFWLIFQLFALATVNLLLKVIKISLCFINNLNTLNLFTNCLWVWHFRVNNFFQR